MQNSKKDIVLKIIPLCLLVLVCGVIFTFSAQNADESKAVSEGLLKKILMYFPFFKNMPPAIYENSEFIIRKTAHFTLYMLLGILALISADSWLKRKQVIIALLFCLLYAISDEVHQLFSAGRSCELRDIFVDFCGSTLGVVLTLSITKLLKRRKKA